MTDLDLSNIPPEPEEQEPLDEGELNARLRKVYDEEYFEEAPHGEV